MKLTKPPTNVASLISESRSFGGFLASFSKEKRAEQDPTWAIGVWSKKLALNNPSQLLNVIAGRRIASIKLGAKIIETLPLNEKEKLYLEFLLLLDHDLGELVSLKTFIEKHLQEHLKSS